MEPTIIENVKDKYGQFKESKEATPKCNKVSYAKEDLSRALFLNPP